MTIIDFATERAKRRPERWQLTASADLTMEQARALAGHLTERYGWTVELDSTGWKEQQPSTP